MIPHLPLHLIQSQPSPLLGLCGLRASLYLVLAAGVGMLALGSLLRKTAWIIPGGVLSGIGLGIVLSEGPWKFPVARQSGLFLLCFALGWFLITLLSRFTTSRTQWWALVPGGIMTALGCIILIW